MKWRWFRIFKDVVVVAVAVAWMVLLWYFGALGYL